MQHSTYQWKKLARLGLPALVILILTVAIPATLDSVCKLEAQAQQAILPRTEAKANQSAARQWIVDTVDTDGGWSPSIVLDQYQRSHIAYSCESGFCYATFNGTRWITETISSDWGAEVSLALDTAGDPHVSYNTYEDPYALKYAYSNGSSWTVETVETIGGSSGLALGRNSALALDAAGHPHITYYGPQPTWDPTDFRHAYHTGSQWVLETVADVAFGNGAGVSSGLLIDSAGNLHALYDGAPTYAHFDGSNWSTQAIASGGFGGSLAMASDGSLHASFISFPSGSDDWYHLKYASLKGSEWSVQEVTRIETETVSSLVSPQGFVWPGATALQLDSLDIPHIAFFNTTDGGSAGYLRYAYSNGSGWVVETVDTQGTPGWARLSLALDPSGYPHIAYLGDWSDRQLRYATLERTSTIVAPDVGGTLTHTDAQSLQTTIEVPAGAVNETVELVFTERAYAPHSPAGFAFAGEGFQLETYHVNGSHIPGYNFTEPVTITVEYSDADMAIVSDESTLELRYWNGTTWDSSGLTIIEHDMNNNRLVVTVAHLSQFAVFGETNQVHLPLVSRALPPTSAFLGNWTNENPNTGGITRVEIRAESDTLYVHMWGKCTPTDCDWGETTTDTSDADDGVLSLTWTKSFKVETQQLRVLLDGRLQVTGHVHYTDNSGRQDRDYTEYFLKQ